MYKPYEAGDLVFIQSPKDNKLYRGVVVKGDKDKNLLYVQFYDMKGNKDKVLLPYPYVGRTKLDIQMARKWDSGHKPSSKYV